MKSQKRKRKKQQDAIVLQLLLIVIVVLVLFEGKLIVTMISHSAVMNQTTISTETPEKESKTSDSSNPSEKPQDSVSDTLPDSVNTVTSSGQDATLAGLAQGSAVSDSEPTVEKLPTVSNPDSPAIVRKADEPVDDSYFSDAVFIGDSRMEGFRNASGITQGQFFTSVGMSISKMASDPIISTIDGNITVAAALSGGKYNKVYIMLGANDLGEYDWDSFHDLFVSTTSRFREIQPDAVFYICSCIYVEEAKVTTGSYVNNANVDKINSILLQICEEQGFYYLDLNEFLSNGYGALIDGASSDGVHIYEKYCKQMLDYMKSHYITVDTDSDDQLESETESELETESDADI